MALKKKLSKEDYEKLSAHLKTEYIEDGEGYKLDIDGDEDTGALKRAKDREAQLRKEAEKELKEAREKLAEIEGNDARKNGDIKTLEKSWSDKHESIKTEYEGKIGKLTSFISTALVDNVALQIASEISTAPKLLIPHIKARLAADFDGETPSTRVLDAAGKPSALKIDELKQEFVANKDFASIIIASKASGGAGKPNNTGSGAPNSDHKPLNLATANPTQIAEHLKAKKQEN